MTCKSIQRCITFLVMCITTIFVHAQNETIETTDGNSVQKAKLTSEIMKIMEAETIPAISIAVINDNKMVYHQALGVGNIETKTPVDKQSIFEAASLSKPIFAYFVMKMVERGKIDLDKPLYEYLPHPGIAPESQEEAKLITARMVLAHQTGFPNHAKGELIKLAFRPGTEFMYSGEGYQYLAAVVGMKNKVGWKGDLNKVFQNEVTVPLQMPHSTFVWDDYLDKHKVYGHNSKGKPVDNKPRTDSGDGSTFFAYSSLHSEAGEYAKFVIAMLKRQGLNEKSFDEMLKEQTHFKDDNPLKKEIGQTGWGLGFAQKKTNQHTMHMHTGNNHDFQAYVMFIPEKKYGLVVFTNSDKMIPFLTNLSKVLGPQF